MNEEVYKLALVKHYSLFEPTCITLEMPFLAGQRRADAVVVYGDAVHGVEIKSDRDNLDNVVRQISDYLRVFDFVWLLVAKNHLKSARARLPAGVGLMVLEGETVKVRRQAKQIRRLDKKALALSLDRFGLLRTLDDFKIAHDKNSGVDILSKQLISRGTIAGLREGVKSQILRKYLQGYQTFTREAGQSMHFEDLLNLGLHRELR